MIVQCSLLILVICHGINGANILAVFPHIGYSHFKVFHPIMRGLAEKGHQVTIASYFPDKEPHENYKDLTFDMSTFPKLEFNMDKTAPRGFISNFIEFWLMKQWAYMTCEKALESFVVDEIIKLHNEKPFDLIITEFFLSDCMLGLVHKLNISFIGLSSCALFPWHYDRVGLPDTPSYIPSQFVRFSQEMDFWQRLENWLVAKGIKYLYRIIEIGDNQLIREKFDDSIPDVAELKLKTSLILVNQHYSLNGPRPLTPGVIEIGGVHVSNDNSLPDDIKEILDNAKDGVILISMGSILRGDSLPIEKREAIINVLRKRPETIIWKWESEKLEGKPKNLILKKWLPQKEILCHPNVKAFMAHGGLLGITETVHCGVPAIVTPFHGDQFLNSAAIESLGMAVILKFQDIDENHLTEALEKVTSKKMFEKAKLVSKAFKDRPLEPLETAIYWIEYVINNNGGDLMRPYSVHMSWFTYYSLDVIGFLVLAVLITCFIALKVLKYVYYKMYVKIDIKEKFN